MDFADCSGLAEGMVFHIETNSQDCFGVREQVGRGEGGGVALAGGIGIVAAEDGAGRKGGEVGGDEGGDASRGAFLQPSVLTYSLSVQSV